MNRQTISLAQMVMVGGVKWQLYPVDFKTGEGTFSVYIYAINREHAAAVLLELKETAVLRDGDLVGLTHAEIQHDALQQRLNVADQRVDDLEVECAALARDAARYRWLRGRNLDAVNQGGVFAGETPRNVVLNGADLDQAIDALLKLAEEGKGS